MKTTAEQRAAMRDALADETYADLNRDEVRDVLAILDDLDEALAELAALRAVAEAGRDLAEVDAHTEYCNVPIFAEQRGRREGLPDSDNWDEAECDCSAGRTRKALRAALRAWEERPRG